MTHYDDDDLYNSFQQESPQNVTLRSPRGYAAQAPGSLRGPPPPSPTRQVYSSPMPPLLDHSVDHHRGVMSSYASLTGANDPHSSSAGAYRPGNDPPSLDTGSRFLWHQDAYSLQSPPAGSTASTSQPASPEVLQPRVIPVSAYAYGAQWSGQPHQVFDEAFDTSTSLYHRPQGLALPTNDIRWSPHGFHGAEHTPIHTTVPPPTPSSALDAPRPDWMPAPVSPHGSTSSSQDPFTHFPDQDPARTRAYLAPEYPTDEAVTMEMLELSSRTKCSCGPDHLCSTPQGIHTSPLATDVNRLNARMDLNLASSSFQVNQNRSIEGPVQLYKDVDAYFPDAPELRELSLHILRQLWCRNNEDEPAIGADEPTALKSRKRTPKSRFEPFFDSHMRCRVVEENGIRCEHVTTRKDRAVGHARAHFGYKPFACGGKCGKPGCLERYTCSSFRNDHIGRKKNPRRPCQLCGKLLTAQNLQRHMKQQHNNSPSPQPEEPARKKLKVSVLRSFSQQ